MGDQEVENILRDIRERVRAAPAPAPVPLKGGAGNGDGAAVLPSREEIQSTNDALALIDSYLTTTARAWDRLPPVMSNRSGTLARFELWVKRSLKRITNWFTWEQVNFNAAVHHALHDTRRALFDHQRVLAGIRLELERHGQLHDEEIKALKEEIRALGALFETQRVQLMTELRERDERLLNDQRVCFKQLSLESTEASVLEDRARRQTEESLAELKRRVEKLEHISDGS